MSGELDTLFEEWKTRVEKLVREHTLQIITWEATRRCDLHCVHCGSPSEEADHAEELSTEEAGGAFDQIAHDFDLSQFRHINITGGEPFVRRDLFEILERLSRWPSFRNTDIQTNGLALAEHPEWLRELKRYGVTGLGISIDGLRDTHDVFRGKAGSFDKAVEAARRAVAEGYVVTVSAVAHARNVDEIPELFAQIKREVRPRVFRVMTLDALGRASSLDDYHLSPEQLRQVLSFLRREYQAGCSDYADPSTTMVELGCGGWLGTDLEGTVRPFIFHCIAGLNNLGILCDGKLGSCSNIPREFIEGDLRRDRIIEVWENRYRRYRDFEWKRTGECSQCDQWDFCHGGPMHKRLACGQVDHCLYLTARKGP